MFFFGGFRLASTGHQSQHHRHACPQQSFVQWSYGCSPRNGVISFPESAESRSPSWVAMVSRIGPTGAHEIDDVFHVFIAQMLERGHGEGHRVAGRVCHAATFQSHLYHRLSVVGHHRAVVIQSRKNSRHAFAIGTVTNGTVFRVQQSATVDVAAIEQGRGVCLGSTLYRPPCHRRQGLKVFRPCCPNLLHSCIGYCVPPLPPSHRRQ